MHDQDKPTTPEGDGENAIQDALRRGVPDAEIIASIIEHTRVDKVTARQIIARERGEPREVWDDLVEVNPSFPQPRRPKEEQ